MEDTGLFPQLAGVLKGGVLLALLHMGGIELLGKPLLANVQTGAADPLHQAQLLQTFSYLLTGSAAVALLGLIAAVALPDRQLRGH